MFGASQTPPWIDHSKSARQGAAYSWMSHSLERAADANASTARFRMKACLG